jgi:transposase
MTFIAGLRQRGMTAPAVIDGAMNGPMFVGYVEQILAPTLKRGEIVFMDNASVHKDPMQSGTGVFWGRRGGTIRCCKPTTSHRRDRWKSVWPPPRRLQVMMPLSAS